MFYNNKNGEEDTFSRRQDWCHGLQEHLPKGPYAAIVGVCESKRTMGDYAYQCNHLW